MSHPKGSFSTKLQSGTYFNDLIYNRFTVKFISEPNNGLKMLVHDGAIANVLSRCKVVVGASTLGIKDCFHKLYSWVVDIKEKHQYSFNRFISEQFCYRGSSFPSVGFPFLMFASAGGAAVVICQGREELGETFA
jgi:hypothetical protein